jgi:hypothetical protein
MTVQTIRVAGREFVLLPKRDFNKLAAQAEQYAEDQYWARSALKAEADAKAKGEKPIPLDEVERELDARQASQRKRRRRK